MEIQQPLVAAVRAAGRGLATVVLVAAGLSMATTEVAAQAAASAVQATEPGAVVRALIDAMKLNDAARMRALATK